MDLYKYDIWPSFLNNMYSLIELKLVYNINIFLI